MVTPPSTRTTAPADAHLPAGGGADEADFVGLGVGVQPNGADGGIGDRQLFESMSRVNGDSDSPRKARSASGVFIASLSTPVHAVHQSFQLFQPRFQPGVLGFELLNFVR